MIFIFQVGGAGSDNTGQRCPKIVGDRPQQIGSHFFLFCFHQQLFPLYQKLGLLFQGSRNGTCDHKDQKHDQKGHRISCHGKVGYKIRIGKEIVDTDHAAHRKDQPIAVSGGNQRGEDQPQGIDQGDIGSSITVTFKDQKG